MNLPTAPSQLVILSREDGEGSLAISASVRAETVRDSSTSLRSVQNDKRANRALATQSEIGKQQAAI
jgi:hypothetical protein